MGAGQPDAYTFGDSERAAARLSLVADTFRATSARFMAERGLRRSTLAVDLAG